MPTFQQARKNTAAEAIANLQAIVAKLDKGAALDTAEAWVLRACAEHVAQELGHQCDVPVHGEVPSGHDLFEWLDLAVYINDPF